MASALANLGIQSSVGGNGLIETEEVIYAIAALRYLIDKRDTLALAKILHFSSEHWQNGEWLKSWLQSEKAQQLAENDPIIQSLREARESIAPMSPSEVLDLALVK